MKSTVLVIESDLPGDRKASRLFDQAGFRVLGPFARISQAWKCLVEEQPYLAVFDLPVPAEDAVRVIDLFNGHQVPTLVFSAHERPAALRRSPMIGWVSTWIEKEQLLRELEVLAAVERREEAEPPPATPGWLASLVAMRPGFGFASRRRASLRSAAKSAERNLRSRETETEAMERTGT